MNPSFCTCRNVQCPLHPSRHDRGCTPCIQKNRKLREIPSCFFNLVDPSKKRSGDSFMDFAALVRDTRPDPSDPEA